MFARPFSAFSSLWRRLPNQFRFRNPLNRFQTENLNRRKILPSLMIATAGFYLPISMNFDDKKVLDNENNQF